MLALGVGGQIGQIQSKSNLGYTKTSPSTQLNSCDMPSISMSAGSTPTGLLPSCPRSARSLGIIKPPETLPLASPPETNSMSTVWRGYESPINGPCRFSSHAPQLLQSYTTQHSTRQRHLGQRCPRLLFLHASERVRKYSLQNGTPPPSTRHPIS